MKVLVTGGAGYIGSHVVKQLVKEHEVIVFDNLSKGHEEAIDKRAKFVKGDLSNFDEIDNCLRDNKIDAVMHFAGSIEAGESMVYPEKYFKNNVVNGLNLLNGMVKNDVKKIIFSSSAAVYGNPKRVPIKEDDETNPTNPYGESKLMFEKILKWYDVAHGVKYVALRYFNAAGASLEGDIGQEYYPGSHLIYSLLMFALGKRKKFEVFGTDYPTKDGTCIRDFIHVVDLTNAHTLTLNTLESKSKVYNVGSESGYSVKEIIDATERITGKELEVIESGRRGGDPIALVANCKRIKEELGWSPQYDLNMMIKSAWDWYKNNPNGYKK